MTYNINKFSDIKFKFNTTDNNIIRLPNKNPNKLQEKKYKLIVFDYENIIIDNILLSIDEFIKTKYDKHIKYICLSKLQRKLAQFKTKDIYYYFPYIEYIDYSDKTLKDQYSYLESLYNKLIEETGFITKYNSIQNQFNIELKYKQSRKLRFKSLLDNNFFFAVRPGYADVFKLLENRPNRSIYQLDVNSMYPDAMCKDNFSNPKDLKYYKKTNLKDILNKTIENGIFNCQLTMRKDLSKSEKEFIKYLPISLIRNNTSLPINVLYKDEINILLHSNEICFYSKYFDIIVEDGVYSSKSITHPLKKWVNDNYENRLKANDTQKDFYKFILVLSHSISMSYYDKYDVMDKETARIMLKEDYQYIIEDYSVDNKYFRMLPHNNSIQLKSYDLKNSNNVYSLYSQVLSNARIHLLELYEKIHLTNSSFELCYCNIDSLHISIPNEKKEVFEEVLKPMISQTELGKLKIESIGDSGIWFEPGRYWIYKNEKLLSFKNTIFNDNNTNPKETFKQVSYYKDNEYITNYFSLFKSLQHKKRIKKVDKNHFIYLKNNKNLSLNVNVINNMQIYKSIFYRFVNNRD